MTNKEFLTHLKTLNLPVSYMAFKESVKAPYLVFYRTDNENTLADDSIYIKKMNYNVELYSDVKNSALEEKIEKLFDDLGLIYDVSESYISETKLHLVTYYVQI